MKVMRKIIEIDEEKCDGCGQCVIACAEGALEIIDGKAKLVSETYCDGLGACIGECPQGAITIVEREAEDFDPEAVEEYLSKKQRRETKVEQAMSCPSVMAQTFNKESLIKNWPVKLKLVAPNSPFLTGCDLLISADCAPVVCPDFHKNLVADRVVLIGCPKFDNVAEYLDKLTTIFRNPEIKSVSILRMEVPCCSGLTGLVKKAMENAGVSITCEETVLRTNGEVLEKNLVNSNA